MFNVQVTIAKSTATCQMLAFQSNTLRYQPTSKKRRNIRGAERDPEKIITMCRTVNDLGGFSGTTPFDV